MWLSLAICCGMLGDGDPGPTPEERAAYESASAEAGRDAEAHVKLALWAERNGMAGERLKHLGLALLADPTNATARGLMGSVRDVDGWRRPEQVIDRVASDGALAAKLAEYNARRAKARTTAKGQYALASWCDQNGLSAEAEAHYSAVVRIDPSRSDAWRKLGCRRYKGRWLNDEQIAAMTATATARREADRRWMPELSDLKNGLRSNDPADRERAEAALASVRDPLAVPSVWRTFVNSKSPNLARAVQILGQIDAPESSEALARLSVYPDSAEVRRAAAENLRWRDRREFLGNLIDLVRKPLQYEIRPNGDGLELYVEGVRNDLRRIYRAPSMPADVVAFSGLTQPQDVANAIDLSNSLALGANRPTTILGPIADPGVQSGAAALAAALGISNQVSTQGSVMIGDGNRPGGPLLTAESLLRDREARAMRNRATYMAAVQETERRVASDVATVEATNDAYHALNNRVLPTLVALTGEDYDADPRAWSDWWIDAQGYAYDSAPPKPTYVTVVDAPRPQYESEPVRPAAHGYCFAAGTPVRTIAGSVPIETIAVGDRVLSQNPETGLLSYRPVVAVYHNRPSDTLKLGIGDESIVATPIHRFWKAGEGWVTARDLRVGDQVRAVGGLAQVESTELDQVRPVFNLEVAEDRSYFVGQAGFLVHDYSVALPVAAPFDAAPTLATTAASNR